MQVQGPAGGGRGAGRQTRWGAGVAKVGVAGRGTAPERACPQRLGAFCLMCLEAAFWHVQQQQHDLLGKASQIA